MPDTLRLLADEETVSQGLERIALELLSPANDLESGSDDGLAAWSLVAVRRGGVAVAEALAAILDERSSHRTARGTVDITLYRDDAATALPNLRLGPSHIPFDVEGSRILLVDDVLYTGRTIRAALNAILDYGRPKRIALCVVAERTGRELPIAADFRVLQTSLGPEYRVEVESTPGGIRVVGHHTAQDETHAVDGAAS